MSLSMLNRYRCIKRDVKKIAILAVESELGGGNSNIFGIFTLTWGR